MDAAIEGTPKRKPGEKSTGKVEGKATAKGKRRLTNSKSQSISSDVELEDEFVGRRSKKPKTNRIGRTAGKNYPPEVQRALGRAHMLYVEGNVTEAAKILSDVVVQCSSIPEPYALLALIFNDIGKLREALQFYKLASTRDPKQLGHHREVARIAGILGDNESRLEALKLLTRLQPTNLNAAIEKARCLFDLQKPKQALDVYAKAAKRFPRRYDIYLDLAEGAECVSPQQHIFVHQALASCLKHAIGKKYLGPDVQDLAAAFAMKLRDIKLEPPKPKRLPPRPTGLPSKRVGEVALMTADLLVMKLMESRKRQEPQYEVAIQVVEGVVSWLDSCRKIANRSDADYEYDWGEEGLSDDKDRLDTDSDIDSDERDSDDGDGDDSELNGEGESDEEVGQEIYDEDGDGEPMDRFTLYPITLLRYGICQLYCGDEGKAAKAFAFLNHEEPDGPHGDMMLQVAKAYAETGHEEESQVLLQQLAHSRHPRHRLASIQLGAAYAAQGKYELASETYAAVLEERPYHAAALAGIAEAAYWRGTTAIPSALKLFNPAVDRATKTWKGDIPEASPCDEEGEVPNDFQMLQLLIQWATLSRIDGNAADFACVALPLVSTALGQWTQRQEFEEKLQAAGGTTLGRGSGAGSEAGSGVCKRRVVSTVEPGLAESKQIAGGEGQIQRDGPPDEQASSEKVQTATWKPSGVPSLLGKMDWEVDLRERVSSLAMRLLESIDVITGVGRRAVFWHLIELVRCLDELRKPSEVGKLVAAAKPNGMLRGLERKDLQLVATKNDTEVLSTMRGGSPILGPVHREGLALGLNSSHQHSASDQACSELYFPPPWRYVEEREEGIWRRGGRAWPLSNRFPQASQRRSRSRALIELAEGEDDGDALFTLVRALSRTPGNDAIWNLLQRVATERGVEAADGGFHGEKVEALITRHRERAHGLLYRGHDAVVWNRSKQALRFYGQAHALRQEEALPILCLATLIIRMVTVMDTMVELDGVCVLQGLACLHRYADLRSPQAQTTATGSDTATTASVLPRLVPAVVLEQEILYNLGRVYQQVGFTELAIEYYNRALRVEDECGHLLRNWHGGEGVTKETAHNLCALYKRTGATAMALRILHKYLSVG